MLEDRPVPHLIVHTYNRMANDMYYIAVFFLQFYLPDKIVLYYGGLADMFLGASV